MNHIIISATLYYESLSKIKNKKARLKKDTGMQIENLENQTNFLLSAALYKCGNLEDAQDLTQDTLLAALNYIYNGNIINDVRGWLMTVLNRKFYQKLRKKYQIATITIGEDFDMADYSDCFENIGQTDEAEQIRKAVAYLSKLHREVIVRHYMNGEKVEKIAEALCISPGTVKSRLSAGREQIKKELNNNMENYEKQSYEPVRLWVSNSGASSIYGEPRSLVDNDLIAQNLLYLAYNEPVTETELAKAIGIPTAYIEPIIKKLVDGELMKRVGNKIYTDFIISTPDPPEKRMKHISENKQFVENNQELFLKSLKTGLEKLRQTDYYKRCNEHQQCSLELYFSIHCFENGTYGAFSNIFDAEQIFPERPNGGSWIAFGSIEAPPLPAAQRIEASKYGYSGRRMTYLENYFDTKSVSVAVYDLVGFSTVKPYYRGDHGNWIDDEDLTKLLYIIESGTNIENTGFNVELLKKIPLLEKCGILKYESDGIPTLDIPVMSMQEWNSMQVIAYDTTTDLKKDIKEVYAEFLKDKKQEIPKHLTSVPLQKQYMGVTTMPDMIAIRLALKQGIIKQEYDYDDDSDPNARFPYSMVFVMDK